MSKNRLKEMMTEKKKEEQKEVIDQTELNKKTKIIDVTLLYRIQRSLGYKSSWVYYAKQQLKWQKEAG